MAAPRAYWRGHIRLALVNFPIRLHAAVTSGGKIGLNMIHGPTGKRIHYQTVADDVGPVERDEIVKGYEVSKGRYVTIEPDELDALKLESKHTIDLVQFVEAADVDAIYYDRPYFVTPDGELAEEAFCVIRDALREAKKVAIGQVVLQGREKLIALKPCGKGLLLETLRYADELKEAEDFFEDISIEKGDPDQVAMARQLIESRTRPFEPEKFHDRYEESLRALINAKAEGAEFQEVEPSKPPKGQVVNLMDALKRSLGDQAPPAERRAPSSRGRGEGKGKKPAAAKDKEKAAPRRGAGGGKQQRRTG